MRNPNKITAWQLFIVLLATAVLCLSVDGNDPEPGAVSDPIVHVSAEDGR